MNSFGIVMVALSDWLPPLAASLTFTALGICKIYGLRKGIVGGGGRPWSCRLQGRCPSWSNEVNILFIITLLSVGMVNFGFVDVHSYGEVIAFDLPHCVMQFRRTNELKLSTGDTTPFAKPQGIVTLKTNLNRVPRASIGCFRHAPESTPRLAHRNR
jgi:hypothetical protein